MFGCIYIILLANPLPSSLVKCNIFLFKVTSSEGFVRLRLGLYIPVGGSRRGGSTSTTLKPLVPSGDGKYRRNRVSDVLAHGRNVTELSDPYSSAEKYLLGTVCGFSYQRSVFLRPFVYDLWSSFIFVIVLSAWLW